ncbi:hypothetical protein H696_02620 [Fonticula alba]|uniref:Nucleolar protein 16 n=1 Tax=Fonticula alba TaxID=691883 RepID=A0A058Z7N4_FONAL|nr:hypothetical protein H696_02620 [Fonticula alba]KCV70290.1 hypothetical protein H696_02620 [Fonticula alba]|eukprot:XP_009494806.1 hypothetical protein H696_02620 [Fonticula alba]
MATARQRRRTKNPNRKVTRRVSDRQKNIHIENPALREAWDKRLTLKQNFERLGLALDPNAAAPLAQKPFMDYLRPLDSLGLAKPVEDPSVLEQFEERASKPDTVHIQRLTENEANRMLKFRQKYGSGIVGDSSKDDYVKMARDLKLNVYQLTANQIKKKLAALDAGLAPIPAVYKMEYAKKAAAKAASEAAAAAAAEAVAAAKKAAKAASN